MTPLAKRLAIGLVISVALNLLCAGFLLGRGVLRQRPRAGSALAGDAPRAWRHPGLRKAYEGRRGEMLAHREASRGARQAVREALATEPFDAARLEETLRTLRGETSKHQQLLHEALVRAAREGTPESRKDLAKTFERERKGPR
jgi:uncharacterized membrane protein